GEFLDHDVGGGLENNGVRSRIHPSLSARRNLVGIAAHSDITVRVETPAGNGRSWRDRVRRRSWGDNGWSKVHDVLNGDRPIQGRLHAPARTSVSCNQFHLRRGRSLVRSQSGPPIKALGQSLLFTSHIHAAAIAVFIHGAKMGPELMEWKVMTGN